jgi:hypothetical protein
MWWFVQMARLVRASCMAILIAGPVIFFRLSIYVKLVYWFISKSPFYRTDYTAFASNYLVRVWRQMWMQ